MRGCAALAALWLAPIPQSSAAAGPAAPDYPPPAAWAAWPGSASRAEDRPAGVSSGSDLGVDVFFIHPTTYLAAGADNAAFDAGGEVGARVDEAVLRFQASGGRAFIIASHSQGCIHALRLLQQQVIGTPLQQRPVAAYLIGVSLPKQIEQRGLPVCHEASQNACVLTWNSARSGHVDHRRLDDSVIWWDGRYQAIGGRPVVCVNPLQWHSDVSADAADNLGALYSAGREQPLPALTGATCEHCLLGVSIPLAQRRRFSDLLTLIGTYHDLDYNLFYINLRANAIERVRAHPQC